VAPAAAAAAVVNAEWRNVRRVIEPATCLSCAAHHDR
jgi:hypothetical protein